jgi:hypothetical protein
VNHCALGRSFVAFTFWPGAVSKRTKARSRWEQVTNPYVTSWISTLLNFQTVCASCGLLFPTARGGSCDKEPPCSIGVNASDSPSVVHANTCGPFCDPDPVAQRSGTGSYRSDASPEYSPNPRGKPSATPRPMVSLSKTRSVPVTTLGNFQSAILGIFILALTNGRSLMVRPGFDAEHVVFSVATAHLLSPVRLNTGAVRYKSTMDGVAYSGSNMSLVSSTLSCLRSKTFSTDRNPFTPFEILWLFAGLPVHGQQHPHNCKLPDPAAHMCKPVCFRKAVLCMNRDRNGRRSPPPYQSSRSLQRTC